MRKTHIIHFGILLTALGPFFYPILSAQAVNHPSTSLSRMEQLILGSTVQISLFPKDDDYYERGLGTVVSYKGERLVVTHNHWTLLRNLDRVEFSNAKGQLLMVLDKREFKHMILYTYPGTLILKAPAGFKSLTVELEAMADTKVGEMVAVVYRKPSDRRQLDIFQAKIQAIVSFEKDSAYQLVASNGENLNHGDSGGGIWLDGRFVGNLWAVENDPMRELLTGISAQTAYAATFPVGFSQFVDMGIGVSQSDAGMGRGKHGEKDVP